jgi:hypothetical protein
LVVEAILQGKGNGERGGGGGENQPAGFGHGQKLTEKIRGRFFHWSIMQEFDK